MGELGQVPSNQAETERRVHPAAHGGEFLGLLHQAEMSAAANQRIVMTGVVRKGGNGRAQEGKRLPEAPRRQQCQAVNRGVERSEEHTSELQSLMRISSAVLYLKKKTTQSRISN